MPQLYQKARCVIPGPHYGMEVWVKAEPPKPYGIVYGLGTSHRSDKKLWYQSNELSLRFRRVILVPYEGTELINEFMEIAAKL